MPPTKTPTNPHHNIFSGPDSLAQYFNPDLNPPLPLVELPATLNPLRKDGVRIFAKMLTALPAQNVKSLPGRLDAAPTNAGGGRRKKTIVEASSGSTALSLGMVAKALWDHDDVQAYVTNKKHADSLKTLRFFGLKPVLYGGLAQQEPSDPKGIMNRLRILQDEVPERICYPGQYDNDDNWKAHERWTGKQLWEQLPEIDIFCTTVGTGGCVTGAGRYLKKRKPSVKVIGVCNIFGDPTPGPRHFPGFESSQFPWQETIDDFETVDSASSFRQSMRLSRHGLIAGPSSGEALQALLNYLTSARDEGRLHDLGGNINEIVGGEGKKNKEIFCVFVCADLPYQYMDLYFQKLGDEEFPEIVNKNLLSCDQNHYDERHFLSAAQTLSLLQPSSSSSASPETLLCLNPRRCDGICRGTASDISSSQQSSLSATIINTPNNPHTTPTQPSPSASSDPWSSPSSPTSSASSSPSAMAVSEPYPTSLNNNACENTAHILDLRPSPSFTKSHFNNATNIPLTRTQEDFYACPLAVEERWREMRRELEQGGYVGRTILREDKGEEDVAVATPTQEVNGTKSGGDSDGGSGNRKRKRGDDGKVGDVMPTVRPSLRECQTQIQSSYRDDDDSAEPLDDRDDKSRGKKIRRRYNNHKDEVEDDGCVADKTIARLVDSSTREHRIRNGNGNGKILVCCLDGDSGKMATAMLRAEGWEAYCLESGFEDVVTGLSGMGDKDRKGESLCGL